VALNSSRRGAHSEVSTFRDQVLDEVAKMIGAEPIEVYSADRIKEIVGETPHLVNFQDFNEILAYVGEARATLSFFYPLLRPWVPIRGFVVGGRQPDSDF